MFSAYAGLLLPLVYRLPDDVTSSLIKAYAWLISVDRRSSPQDKVDAFLAGETDYNAAYNDIDRYAKDKLHLKEHRAAFKSRKLSSKG